MGTPLRIAETCTPSKSDRLWSLWEMLERHAYLFAVPTTNLADMLAQIENSAATPKRTRNTREILKDFRRALILSEMDDPLPQLTRLEALVGDNDFGADFVADGRSFLRRLFDDLNSQYYFHVDQRDVQYYGNKDAFGLTKSSKFDEVLSDAEAAGNCIAFHQSTAAVFHLMRVLERGIIVLATALKVKLDPKATWYDIVREANTAVGKLPSKNKRQISRKEELAVACAHLQTVRLAWRNPVMHPKQSYTPDEGLEVFNSTRVFISHLAALL